MKKKEEEGMDPLFRRDKKKKFKKAKGAHA